MLMTMLISVFPAGDMRDAARGLNAALTADPQGMAELKRHFGVLAEQAQASVQLGLPASVAFAGWLEEYQALQIRDDTRVAVAAFMGSIMRNAGAFDAKTAPRLLRLLSAFG